MVVQGIHGISSNATETNMVSQRAVLGRDVRYSLHKPLTLARAVFQSLDAAVIVAVAFPSGVACVWTLARVLTLHSLMVDGSSVIYHLNLYGISHRASRER